jgi:uncharacterized SAM-binding protein YcdF (DUF218 family)
VNRKPASRSVRPVQKAGRASRRRWLARLLALPLLAWALGFLWFSLTLPAAAPLSATSDGVVVLTGGAGRFRRGLAVVEAGSARRMLVSGVGRNTTRRQLAAAFDIDIKRLRTTDLGYAAQDTRSNAEETAAWVATGSVRSGWSPALAICAVPGWNWCACCRRA